MTLGEGELVNTDDYILVYNGLEKPTDNPVALLEKLFIKFNIDRPEDFHEHSLSVSDIIALQDDNSTTYYRCETRGWTLIKKQVKGKKVNRNRS